MILYLSSQVDSMFDASRANVSQAAQGQPASQLVDKPFRYGALMAERTPEDTNRINLFPFVVHPCFFFYFSYPAFVDIGSCGEATDVSRLVTAHFTGSHLTSTHASQPFLSHSVGNQRYFVAVRYKSAQTPKRRQRG